MTFFEFFIVGIQFWIMALAIFYEALPTEWKFLVVGLIMFRFLRWLIK